MSARGVKMKGGTEKMIEARVRLETGLFALYCVYDRETEEVISAAFSPSGQDVFDALPEDTQNAVFTALENLPDREEAPDVWQKTATVLAFPSGGRDGR